MGAVNKRFCSDEPCLRQFIDDLLQCQIAGIFLFKDKVADLSHSERKGYFVEQIEHDQLIKCEWFLIHNNYSPVGYFSVS